ncbi:retrovirus-related pol polyprotein from transposon TNT 1-94 [Tanacetum coccineum]
MDEVNILKEQIKVPSENSPSISQTRSSKSSKAKKTPMIPKPFKECKYYGFNDHHSDNYEYYSGCEVCCSVAHEPIVYPKKHPNSRKSRIATKRSTKPTEKVAYVNGLKHNLINISQLCDANFKVLFTKTQGTIFNQNDEVVLIALYVIDMLSYKEESNACFFSKSSPSINWLWHKRLSHLKFKNINKLAKQNLGASLPSLTFSKDKNYSTCEKGKHHRASFKTRRSFSINKCLRLLHMNLFGPVKPQTINHNKYTLVIIDEYSRDQLGKFDEKADMDSSLATLQRQKHLGYSTSKDKKWKKHIMLQSVKMRNQFLNPTQKDSVSPEEPPEFTSADDHPSLNKHDLLESVDILEPAETQDTIINEPISDVQPSPTNSPSAEGILQSSVPQDRWSRENHIKLVNIIGEHLTSITTRSKVKDSKAASSHACMYVNFLSKIEPKKLIEALEEEGWIIAM